MSPRLDQLKQLYDADPTDPFVPYGIALEHAKAGEHEQALSWLDRTLEIDPQYSYAYFQKGRLLSELGRPDDAKQTLETGITRARESGDTHAAEEIAGLLATLQ